VALTPSVVAGDPGRSTNDASQHHRHFDAVHGADV
ncbi:uncharacterized protein METZ01_LOCUS409004, partial [marine metagenome]